MPVHKPLLLLNACIIIYKAMFKKMYTSQNALKTKKLTGLKSGIPSCILRRAISDFRRFLCAGFVIPIAVRSWEKKKEKSPEKLNTTNIKLKITIKCLPFNGSILT